ncbi:MAG: protein phosphatase 2C domain-containing protein [Aridibacter sp.]
MAQDNFQISSAAVSDKGLSEKRPQNEDSYLELRDSGIYAVADGVGGAQAGDVASQMATEILGDAFRNLQENGDAEERMKAAIEQANAAIFQMSNDLAQLSTMATTVVALHINGNIATIGHVGDSRLYRLDSNGNLIQETQDHSVVEEEVRAGRLTPEQAAVHPSRNVISRALGAESGVEIDMKTIMFEPETTFLICTDGITRHIPDTELKEILSSGNDVFNICQQLKTLCYERGAEDNLTAVLVKVSQEEVRNLADEKPFELDLEEPTVAAARPPLVNSSVLSSAVQAVDEPNDEILFEDTLRDAKIEREQENISEHNIENDSFTFPTDENDKSLQKDEIATADVKSYKNVEASDDNIAGKIISGMVWLLIGGLIGAGITYFWLNNQKSETETSFLKPRSENVTPFEQRKSEVDNNPAQYIAANVSPQNAEDYYLIGRAYLRQGNFAGARTAFENAKEKLSGNNDTNNQGLVFEIAQGLAVVNDPVAQTEFQKELGIPVSENSNKQTNNADANSTNFNTSDANSTNKAQGEPEGNF